MNIHNPQTSMDIDEIFGLIDKLKGELRAEMVSKNDKEQMMQAVQRIEEDVQHVCMMSEIDAKRNKETQERMD